MIMATGRQTLVTELEECDKTNVPSHDTEGARRHGVIGACRMY